jgi:hypothetical protein
VCMFDGSGAPSAHMEARATIRASHVARIERLADADIAIIKNPFLEAS